VISFAPFYIVMSQNSVGACDSYIFTSGQTALHISAAMGQLEICRLLLLSNADLHAKDNE
jgi:ankyrin repeat protein